MNKRPKLSIAILSYNTKDLLVDCLKSLNKVSSEVDFEVIVVDNNSSDDSVKAIKNLELKIKNHNLKLKVIENRENVGFARGNNSARKYCLGEYVLFLNSDTLVHKKTLRKTVEYLDEHRDVGVVTVKMELSDGGLDKDARRHFPTPWVALTHLVLHLDKVFPKSKLIAQYWYGYISPDNIHEIDVAQGAYYLTRRKILNTVGWFDEDYFLDGEDIDLCWKIKQKGWKIVYYPKATITHIKKASKKKSGTKSERKRIVTAGVESMELFYRKRWWDRYPKILNWLVVLGVRTVKLGRIMKLSLEK